MTFSLGQSDHIKWLPLYLHISVFWASFYELWSNFFSDNKEMLLFHHHQLVGEIFSI